MSITQQIESLQKVVMEKKATLVAMSKEQSPKKIQEAYAAGQRIFGENKVQDLLERKKESLPADIQWHMVGHLQSNKVKDIAPFIALIHSVDSFKLLEEINKQALKNNRVIDCLLQVSIAEETEKFGLDHAEVVELLRDPGLPKLQNIRIVGLMGIATYTSKKAQIRAEFHELEVFFKSTKVAFKAVFPAFNVLSMGMSSDYTIALEEGSTLVRLGSSIFGARKTSKKKSA